MTVAPTSLTFTTSNWDDLQGVVVTAAHDNDDAEDDTAKITLSASGGIVAEDVEKEISVNDDDTAGTIVLSDAATLMVDEGDTGEFNVKLSVQPDAQVTVTLTSDDDDVTLDPTMTRPPRSH
ncbi:MAG: hypothetical protein ISN28_13220 [Ectothiorhodospiraceae bacterium AqS1]|nr:hypothetical protein [Ectothiorhodospiraceae bacterium AqS1]